MADLLLIAWRDIPAQLLAREGRRSARRELSPRFAEAIDRAAMRAGARDEAAYLAGWTRKPLGPCAPELEAAVEAAVDRIEAEYDAARLARLVQSGGVA